MPYNPKNPDIMRLAQMEAARKRGENPEMVDGNNQMMEPAAEAIRPGTDALQDRLDVIRAKNRETTAEEEKYGGRAPMAEGEIRGGQVPLAAAAPPAEGNMYEMARRLNEQGQLGDKDIQLLKQVEADPSTSPAEKAERFKELKKFWLQNQR